MVVRLSCRFATFSTRIVLTCRSPVFDSAADTYDALHKRSPFAVNAICMVAARVRDGGCKQALALFLSIIP